jgi:hypothetical protein
LKERKPLKKEARGSNPKESVGHRKIDEYKRKIIIKR